MIRLFALLVVMIAIIVLVIGYRAWLGRQTQKHPRPGAFACACGCGRAISGHAGWDGYHGPDFRKPVNKAIDKPEDYVLGWQDIEWTVEKRLPKED